MFKLLTITILSIGLIAFIYNLIKENNLRLSIKKRYYL